MPRGARRLPPACLRRLDATNVILHAGDFVRLSVLEELAAIAPVHAVAGNMDEGVLRDVLPQRRVVELEGTRVGMVHDPGPAAGRAERLAAEFPGCNVVVYGHTHAQDVKRVGETWILNPGSPTERRSSPHHGMAELEVSAADLTVRTHVL